MIGVYDSGQGGLGALACLHRQQPKADLLYFADTAHLPYGSRSHADILNYADAALSLFVARGASALLVACGTVSTVALPKLMQNAPFPVYGIIEPSVARASSGRRILVLGTSATISGGAFARSLSVAAPNAAILPLACPTFVPLIESGAKEADVIAAIADALMPAIPFAPDTILLACTHFPLFSMYISNFFPGAELIDAGAEAAKAIPHSADAERGDITILVSQKSICFEAMAKTCFPASPIHVIKS